MASPIHPSGVKPPGWIVLVVLLIPASVSAAPGKKVDQALRTGVTWDAEVQVAFAVAGIDGIPRRFFVRGRAGILSAHEPMFFTAGATIEASGPVGIAGGLELGLSHLWSGVWAQGGLSVDEDADTFIHLSVGYTILGFEWHRRLTGDPAAMDDRDVWMVEVRLPIGIYVFAY